MAQEMILVPKAKYEKMMERVTSEKKTIEPKKEPEDEPSTDTLQEGSGFSVRKRTRGPPPGYRKKTKKTVVKWIKF